MTRHFQRDAVLAIESCSLTDLQKLLISDRESVQDVLLPNGETCATKMTLIGWLAGLELLAEHKVDLNLPNKKGESPAHVAARIGHGSLAVFECLLNAGVELSSKDRKGQTPLGCTSINLWAIGAQRIIESNTYSIAQVEVQQCLKNSFKEIRKHVTPKLKTKSEQGVWIVLVQEYLWSISDLVNDPLVLEFLHAPGRKQDLLPELFAKYL